MSVLLILVSLDLYESFTLYDWVFFALKIINSHWNLKLKDKGHYISV